MSQEPKLYRGTSAASQERRRESIKRASFKYYHNNQIHILQQDLSYLRARLPEVREQCKFGILPVYKETELIAAIDRIEDKIKEHELKLASMKPAPRRDPDPWLTEARHNRQLQQKGYIANMDFSKDTALSPEELDVLNKILEADPDPSVAIVEYDSPEFEDFDPNNPEAFYKDDKKS